MHGVPALVWQLNYYHLYSPDHIELSDHIIQDIIWNANNNNTQLCQGPHTPRNMNVPTFTSGYTIDNIVPTLVGTILSMVKPTARRGAAPCARRQRCDESHTIPPLTPPPSPSKFRPQRTHATQPFLDAWSNRPKSKAKGGAIEILYRWVYAASNFLVHVYPCAII